MTLRAVNLLKQPYHVDFGIIALLFLHSNRTHTHKNIEKSENKGLNLKN